MAFNMEVGL